MRITDISLALFTTVNVLIFLYNTIYLRLRQSCYERPILRIIDTAFDIISCEKHEKLRISRCLIMNCGQTPALNVRMYWTFFSTENPGIILPLQLPTSAKFLSADKIYDDLVTISPHDQLPSTQIVYEEIPQYLCILFHYEHITSDIFTSYLYQKTETSRGIYFQRYGEPIDKIYRKSKREKNIISVFKKEISLHINKRSYHKI